MQSLFGTLDVNDLVLINQNMDKLFDRTNIVTHIVQNQTAIIRGFIKEQLDATSLHKIKTNDAHIEKIENRKQTLNNLLIADTLINSILNKVNDFYLMIILGKQSIIDTGVIPIESFLTTYRN